MVAAITPWNAPLYLNVTESVPALLAGNAVILKPAQLTPWAGLELGRIAAEETDIPPGIFQVVVSNDNDVVAMLTSDPRVDMVTFTGSTAVGWQDPCGDRDDSARRRIMELGGKSTHIVLDDADLAAVLPSAAGGVCTMSGQGCTNATRVLLPRRRLAEGLGDPEGEHRAVPLRRPVGHEELFRAVYQRRPAGQGTRPDRGRRGGPCATPAGRAASRWICPPGTTSSRRCWPMSTRVPSLARRRRSARSSRSTPYDTEDEAVAIANDTVYGLAGQVSSGDDEHALAVALRIRTGTVGANVASTFSMTSPLGGVGQSGLGRRYGDHGFEEYLEVKAIGLPAIVPAQGSGVRPAGEG